MKYLFSLLALFACTFAQAKEAEHKNYVYLTSGVAAPGVYDISLASTIGGGYRIAFDRYHSIDGIDLQITYFQSHGKENKYDQVILPRLLFLHNVAYIKSLYFGLGGSYCKANYTRSFHHKVKDGEIHTRAKMLFENTVFTAALGLNVYKTPSSINFIECSINVPLNILRQADSWHDYNTFLALTFNAGF